MKKLVVILLVITLCLTGCWDSIELNDIVIVTGMAVDPGKDKRFKLTLEYVNSAQFSPKNPEQGAPVSTMSLEGDSLPEIARKMNIGVSRKIIYSHTRALFINEKIAKEGLIRFLDSLDRSEQFRNDFNILITQGNAAESFIRINDPVEKIPSVKVQKQIKSLLEEWGGDPRVRLTDFLNAVISKGRSPIVSTVSIKGDPEKGKNSESNMSIERVAMIELEGIAVFKQDRVVGFLTLEDTRNYLWTQDLEKTSVSFPCHKHVSGEEEEFVDIHILNNSSQMNTDYEHNRPVLKVEINSEAELVGMQCSKDLTKMETYEQFEKKAETYIKNSVTDTIKKVQSEYGTDIFGFGEALNRQHYKKYKEVEDHWDEEFTRADVEISVTVKLRRSGIKNKSFLTEMPEEVSEE